MKAYRTGDVQNANMQERCLQLEITSSLDAITDHMPGREWQKSRIARKESLVNKMSKTNMQELEKILEEIQKVGNIQLSSYTKLLIAAGDVKNIIRKHMSDDWIPVEENPKKRLYGGFCG